MNERTIIKESHSVATTELPRALFSEHLAEDVKPIISCLVDLNRLPKKSLYQILQEDFANVCETALLTNGRQVSNVEYAGRNKYHESNNMIYLSDQTDLDRAIISDFDAKDKYSKGFYDCVGVVVVGRDSVSGENISLMTHSKPAYLLEEQQGRQFATALSDRLNLMVQQCDPCTIDAVVAGGRSSTEMPADRLQYRDSVVDINKITTQVLGFSPVVLPPKGVYGVDTTELYFDTSERRLYVRQPLKDTHASPGFSGVDIDDETHRWHKKD